MSRSSSRRFEERAGRLLAALAPTGGRLVPQGGDAPRWELCVAGERTPRLVVDARLVEAMLCRDWLRRDDDGVAATGAGLAWLRRLRAGGDPWRGQHLLIEAAGITDPAGGPAKVALVANESPLAWLRRRRGADGRPMVGDVQFAAGERLRADFERGRMGPRLTVDWMRPPLGRGRRGPASGPADVADSVLAARRRVEAALRALGPELGGLLVDVCCFLTGLEDAERRRAWPRRSAKVVLSIALDRLAAHYGLAEAARGLDRSDGILHWGEEDYRPRMDTETVS